MLALNIEKRKVIGKASKILPSDVMPAVYYGHKETSTAISVSKAAFKKILRDAGEAATVVLKGDGKELETLIHDIDFDPIKGEPRHADFYVLEKGKKVKIKVPIHFEGIAPAIKNLGGVLVKVLYEIEIEAMPKDLPHSITVNLESLENFESQIHIKDVVFPSGVTSLEGKEEVVAAIAEPREEKEEEVAPIDLTSIEVEKKGKKEGEGGEGTETVAAVPEKKFSTPEKKSSEKK